MKTVTIGRHRIGPGHPCFLIAEAGSNHNGSLEQAMALIDLAADAGADAVKFQVFRAARMYPKRAGVSAYLKTQEPIYDIIRKMEMPFEWLPKLAARCDRRGILFSASAFDEASADRLDPFVQFHKVASFEMTHLPLVRHLAEKGKPMIVSTGTATLNEVAKTVEAVRQYGNPELVLMQCTAAYPAPPESLNIKALVTMREAFGLPVGLSDHSRDPFVGPLVAIGCGADLLEKHLTLDNDLPGPDHCFAVEPEEFRALVAKVRAAECAVGTGNKKPHPVEEELRVFARRSIFSLRPIETGEAFTADNIAVLRCGELKAGLQPEEYPQVLERKATRRIEAEVALQSQDVS